MTEVKFEEEKLLSEKKTSDLEPGLLDFLLSRGVVKTKQQAQSVLFAVLVLAIVLIIFLIKGPASTGLKNPPDDLISAPQPRGPIK